MVYKNGSLLEPVDLLDVEGVNVDCPEDTFCEQMEKLTELRSKIHSEALDLTQKISDVEEMISSKNNGFNVAKIKKEGKEVVNETCVICDEELDDVYVKDLCHAVHTEFVDKKVPPRFRLWVGRNRKSIIKTLEKAVIAQSQQKMGQRLELGEDEESISSTVSVVAEKFFEKEHTQRFDEAHHPNTEKMAE